MTLYYIVFQFKNPSNLPTRQKLKLSPLLLKNLRAVIGGIKKIESLGGAAEAKLMEEVTNFFNPLLTSDSFKGAYQLFDRYDHLSADLTFVFIADWTYKEATMFISQIGEFFTNVTQTLFAQVGLKMTTKELKDVLEMITPLEVHKALPLRRALDANLAAAKRRVAMEANVPMASAS